MNTSGEADQIIKIALDGTEVALKITGVAAKEIATMIYAIMKDQKKSKGKTRIENLIKSGSPLTILTIKENDHSQFIKEAKRYGVLYGAIRGTKDGAIDIMIKQEDLSRVNRIIERFNFADLTGLEMLKEDIQRSKQTDSVDKTSVSKKQPINRNDDIFSEIYNVKKEDVQNPTRATMVKSPLSEHTYKTQNKMGTEFKKNSVRQDLKNIINLQSNTTISQKNVITPLKNKSKLKKEKVR